RETQLAVAKKVKLGTSTSSPGPISSAISDRSRASLPEAQPMPYFVCETSALVSSSWKTSGPNRKRPESSTASRASMNSLLSSAVPRPRSSKGTLETELDPGPCFDVVIPDFLDEGNWPKPTAKAVRIHRPSDLRQVKTIGGF